VSLLGYGSASSVYEGKAVGWGEVGYEGHAGVWDIATSNFVDLNPNISDYSWAQDTHDQSEVGQVWLPTPEFPGGQPHAALWHGTADSYVDLNPPTFPHSYAYGGDGGYQVGVACNGVFLSHAALWHGTADSYVDLNPAGASESGANDMFGGVEGGWADIDGTTHAGLWTGTSDSWVDLGPGAISVGGMYGHRQVGNDPYGACIWNGTSSGRVELGSGSAVSIYDHWEVGNFTPSQPNGWGPGDHACIWNDTAVSRVDLGAILLNSYNLPSSYADGVYASGGEIWVAGNGVNPEYGGYAVLWHYAPDPVPEPSSLLVLLLALPAVAWRFRRMPG